MLLSLQVSLAISCVHHQLHNELKFMVAVTALSLIASIPSVSVFTLCPLAAMLARGGSTQPHGRFKVVDGGSFTPRSLKSDRVGGLSPRLIAVQLQLPSWSSPSARTILTLLCSDRFRQRRVRVRRYILSRCIGCLGACCRLLCTRQVQIQYTCACILWWAFGRGFILGHCTVGSAVSLQKSSTEART